MSDYIQSPAHRALSLQAALESIVLLKNSEKNGLPISSSTMYTACVSLASKPSVSFQILSHSFGDTVRQSGMEGLGSRVHVANAVVTERSHKSHSQTLPTSLGMRLTYHSVKNYVWMVTECAMLSAHRRPLLFAQY